MFFNIKDNIRGVPKNVKIDFFEFVRKFNAGDIFYSQ